MKTLILTLFAAALFAQDPAPFTPWQMFTTDPNTGALIPCAGCTISTYAAGTNTPSVVFTNSDLTTPNTNPVQTNSGGYVVNGNSPSTVTGIWIGTSCYKFVAKNAIGVTLWTQDNICDRGAALEAMLSGASGSSFIGYKYSGGATARTVQNKLQETESVVDFGADKHGMTPSSAAFTAAIAASGGGSVFIPCGTYLIDSTITVAHFTKFLLYGSNGCVNLVWSGNSTTPLLMVSDCLACQFQNFTITGNASFPLLYAIQTINSGSGGPTASQNVFNDIDIQGVAGYITTGVYMGGGVDGNNDQQRFTRVYVSNYTHSAFTINHSQIYDVVFNNCGFAGDGYGAIGVENLSGNFYWLHGDGGGNTSQDFFISLGGGGVYKVEGGKFETSAQFLKTGGPAGNIVSVVLDQVVFSADCLGASAMTIKTGSCGTPPGGIAILFQYNGILSIKNSSFGTSTSVPLVIQGASSCESCVFVSSNTTTSTIFTVDIPVYPAPSYSFDPGSGTRTALIYPSVVAPISWTDNSSTQDVSISGGLYFTSFTAPTVLTNLTGCTGPFDIAIRDFRGVGLPGGSYTSIAANGAGNIQMPTSLFQATYEDVLHFQCLSKGGVVSLVGAVPINYTGVGFNGTKVAGSCTFTIIDGIITGVSGC